MIFAWSTSHLAQHIKERTETVVGPRRQQLDPVFVKDECWFRMLDLLIVFTGQACGSSSPILHPISTEEYKHSAAMRLENKSSHIYEKASKCIHKPNPGPILMMSTLGAIVSTQMERPKNRKKKGLWSKLANCICTWRNDCCRASAVAPNPSTSWRWSCAEKKNIPAIKSLRHCCCAVQFGRDDADGLPTAIYLTLSS